MAKTTQSRRRSRSDTEDDAEPAWDIARLFPPQGAWTQDDYLELGGNYLVEFANGVIEVLPRPTTVHQRIVCRLVLDLRGFSKRRNLGEALCAPLRVRLWPRKFREPDVVFMLAEHAARKRNEYWLGADLVIEVVSGDAKDRHRDLVTKRREYARAKIPEYWIVDPRDGWITVLTLKGAEYAVAGEYTRGARVRSVLLKGFEVDAADVFDAADEE